MTTTRRAVPWHPDALNGIGLAGNFVVGNDPRDTSMRLDLAFVRDWVIYL
jgi:hypothetical protein